MESPGADSTVFEDGLTVEFGEHAVGAELQVVHYFAD